MKNKKEKLRAELQGVQSMLHFCLELYVFVSSLSAIVSVEVNSVLIGPLNHTNNKVLLITLFFLKYILC